MKIRFWGALLLPALLAAGGTFVLGHSKRDTLDIPNRWRERKLLKHGDSIMRLLGGSGRIVDETGNAMTLTGRPPTVRSTMVYGR